MPDHTLQGPLARLFGFSCFGSLDPSPLFPPCCTHTDVNAVVSGCWWFITAHLFGGLVRIPCQLVLLPVLSMEFGVCYLVVLFWVCVGGGWRRVLKRAKPASKNCLMNHLSEFPTTPEPQGFGFHLAPLLGNDLSHYEKVKLFSENCFKKGRKV